MQGTVRFKRKHNRTAEDVFNNMIRPKIPLTLDVMSQKIVHYARKIHSYQNRTGALENSVSWMPAKRHGSSWRSAVLAGGPSKAKYTYTQRVVFYYDEQHRLRVFEPKNPRTIRKGTPINVNYAVFVELKGMPVLKHAIEHFRRQIARMCAQLLRMKNMPRVYQFKHTGETRDIYGNGG